MRGGWEERGDPRLRTRIAFIADVHGNLPALEAVAADISVRGVTRVVNLGDHVSGPLWPRETLDFLMHQPWITIAGNHDRQVVHDDPASHGASDRYAFAQLGDAQKRWLTALPATCLLDEGSILLCHGRPDDDNSYLLDTPDNGRLSLARQDEIQSRLGHTKASLIACGHSHIPRLVYVRGRIAIVNPGSVGLQAYRDDGPEPHVSENGSPLARYALLEPDSSGWRVAFLSVPYDYAGAARRAEANGRPEWAFALRTGFAASI